MRKSRRLDFLAWSLIATALVAATACAPSRASPVVAGTEATHPPLLKLKVADAATPPVALPQSTVSLALQGGFFEREGLDVTIDHLTGTPEVLTAMRAGDIDIGSVNASDVLRLQADGTLDVRVIGSPNGRNFWMIIGRSTLGSLNDLRGQSYAISRVGSEDHSLALTVLAAKGVDRSEINFLSLGVPNIRMQALLANQIAATTTTLGTWITVRNQPGLKVLVGPDEFWNTAPLMTTVSAVTATVAREKADALHRYTRAMLQAARYYASSKANWVSDMGTLRPDIQASDLAELWDQVGSAWAVNGQLNLTTFQKTSDYLYATEDFKGVRHIEVGEWVDTEFVDMTLRELGVYPGIDEPGRSVGANQ